MAAMRDDLLFYGQDLGEVGRQQQDAVAREIEQYDENKLLNTPPEDLSSYLLEKYRIEPLFLDEAAIQTDTAETKYDTQGDFRYMAFPGERSAVIPATRTSFFVPFTGDAVLFRCKPSTYTLNPPRATIAGSELVLSFVDPNPDPVRTKQQFDAAIAQIRQYVGWINEGVAGINVQLAGAARNAIEQRRQRLLQARQATAAIGFPIRRRPGAPTTYTAPTVRRKVLPPPPASSAPFVPEPTLSMEEYERILEIIQNMVLVMERSPAAFSAMKEEDLRQHFLVQLNGQYEGAAMGEVFNMAGKTDILIREGDKNIFIGECKFWAGPAQFRETVDQVLSYLSWRDTKAAILLFCRNKDFSAVLSQIPGLLSQHPKFKRSMSVTGDTRSRAVMSHENDPSRELILTVASFHLPS